MNHAPRVINFTKLQGIGNDFVLIDSRTEKLDHLNLKKLAIEVCDRNFGVGADGILIVLPSEKASYRMQIINSDGSEAEACGNGIRCFARYVFEKDKLSCDVISVETKAGIALPTLIEENGIVSAVEVDMGEPRIESRKLKVESREVDVISMGNPHAVIFVDDLSKINLAEIGPIIEIDKAFPNKTNVEFVKVISKNEIEIKVWERGAGITLACGTGACAAVVASVENQKTSRQVLVHLPGGDLNIEWKADDNHVIMSGPAEKVFEGQYTCHI